jgi:hypothetical protein
MLILETTVFKKTVKKLHKNQKIELDGAIRTVANNPTIGDAKVDNLSDIRVYKFSLVNQLTLLAYKYNIDSHSIILLALGTHENFYRDLKIQLSR